MIRLAGAALAALGCAWLGLTAAAELGRRVRRLEELSAGLELLERELWERGNPLPEVFCSLSSRTQGAARALFLQGAECCRRLEKVPFSQAWRQSVEGLEGVTPEGRAALAPLGEVLGRYEAGGQREAIQQARAALERARGRAAEERRRMGRVYQALGLSGGGFLVILLL